MKVLKFGGSSLADSNQFRKVKDIILSDSERKYVVVSAPGKGENNSHKVTDLLLMCYQLSSHGLNCKEVFEIVENIYKDIVNDLCLKIDIDKILEDIYREIQDGASKDFTASRGEYLNAILLSNFLGFNFIDAKDVIYFKDGKPDFDKIKEKVQDVLKDKEYSVIPGFYGGDESGNIKIFSRGGSDITGSIIADALDSDVYENWTDVSGFLVADPHIVENPRVIKYITYDELRELSYMGAHVLHEDSIFPVKRHGITINIRNTNKPNDDGTFIISHYDDNRKPDVITGIAGRPDFSVVTIKKAFMNSELGFLRKVMSVFETNDIKIDHIPSGIDSVSLVVESSELSGKISRVTEEIKIYTDSDSIEVEDKIALITVVGDGMINKKGTSAKIFTSLAQNDVNIRMISQGSSELNIIIGVLQQDFKKAIRAIYYAFN